MAPLAARRLGEMVELGERIAAIGLAVAMQAIQLRPPAVVGSGTAQVLAAARACRGSQLGDVRPLVELVRSGLLSSIR
jgi:histidine ammonia-lyase